MYFPGQDACPSTFIIHTEILPKKDEYSSTALVSAPSREYPVPGNQVLNHSTKANEQSQSSDFHVQVHGLSRIDVRKYFGTAGISPHCDLLGMVTGQAPSPSPASECFSSFPLSSRHHCLIDSLPSFTLTRLNRIPAHPPAISLLIKK